VEYDDGDAEWINLAKEQHKLLPADAAAASSKRPAAAAARPVRRKAAAAATTAQQRRRAARIESDDDDDDDDGDGGGSSDDDDGGGDDGSDDDSDFAGVCVPCSCRARTSECWARAGPAHAGVGPDVNTRLVAVLRLGRCLLTPVRPCVSACLCCCRS
jgi:hypothetical protein